MKLISFYALWNKFGENELIITDRKRAKVYYDINSAIEDWHREVEYFYISDNKLFIRIK